MSGEITVESGSADEKSAAGAETRLSGLEATDERPVLLVAVNTAEKTPPAVASTRLMANVFDIASPDADALARETQLFRCIKLDATDVPAAALSKWKIGGAPALMILTPGGETVNAINATGLNPKALLNALETVLKNQFKEYYAKVQGERAKVQTTFAEAGDAVRKGDLETAKSKLQEVITSRVGSPLVADARKQLAGIEKKEAAAAPKENKG